MELPQSIKDQIREEAEKLFPYTHDPFYPNMSFAQRVKCSRDVYIKAGESWAIWKQKAEVYEKALEQIADRTFDEKYIAIEDVRIVASTVLRYFNPK